MKSKMIRTAIVFRLKELKISKRRCAIDNQIDYQNFYNFLKGTRPMPIPDIESVLKYLNLKIKP